MKAFVYKEYGSPDVLSLQEVEKPRPKDDEVLVKIQATAANAADKYLLKGEPFLVRLEYGLRRPKRPILGSDIAGRVEAIGSKVSTFKPGDAVFADLSGCGMGGFAEYVAVPESVLSAKPESLSFEEAAAVPMAAVTALQGLRKGGIKEGQRVLIHGASGGVGTFAVQIAKALGAHVTAVCSSSKVALVQSLGVDHIIDYTQEDFSRTGARYDLILVANGGRSLFDYRRALAPNGNCVVVGGAMKQIFEGMLLGGLLSLSGGKKMSNLLAKANPEDLRFVSSLIAAGKVSPVIDRCYPLEALPEAMRYLEQGHAKGKIVITIGRHRHSETLEESL